MTYLILMDGEPIQGGFKTIKEAWAWLEPYEEFQSGYPHYEVIEE